jgi:hypothetical protein
MDMHDMHGMTMSTATSTTSAAMAGSTGMDMGGMDMGGMHGGNSCKISVRLIPILYTVLKLTVMVRCFGTGTQLTHVRSPTSQSTYAYKATS